MMRMELDGQVVALRPLAALEEIRLDCLGQDYAQLLHAMGLKEPDAQAVGQNAALVFLASDLGFESPRQVLEQLSLAQLAELASAARQVQQGTLEGDVL